MPARETELLDALRRGEESAFLELVESHHAALLRLARIFVRTPAAAEDVVQETWLAVVRGIDRFEGRSSLKTWISRILANRAKTHAQRDGRWVAFSTLAQREIENDERAVDSQRFQTQDDEIPGHWAIAPRPWRQDAEQQLLTGETLEHIREAITTLPEAQREVITLRDVEGWTAQEVCNALEITETNQRVLLHRARTKVRRALEQYFERK